MTKKNFIALADHIKAENQHPDKPFNERAIQALADFCWNQNHAFMRDRWLGYIAGTNGKNGRKVA